MAPRMTTDDPRVEDEEVNIEAFYFDKRVVLLILILIN